MSESSTAVASPPASPPGRRLSSRLTEPLLYWAAVALGGVLTVLTAINQPYNENEWAQIKTYGSSDPSVIISGTRQPPLDPLLGALVQHLLGEGQLRQRLVPVVFGIGCLVVMALLLRRMRLGSVGVLTMFFIATAPVFLRYAAYIRPYALPMFLMLVCCYAGVRWLEDGGRRWLVLAVVSALVLPVTRVPEPMAFLGTSALILVWAGWRQSLPRGRALPLAGGFLLAMISVGGLMFTSLASRTSGVFDTNPSHAIDRAPAGVEELVTYVLPLFGEWFPWWPITLVFLVLACALRDARQMLRRTWYWLPLLVAPLVFMLAYHFINPFPLDIRHYRARFMYFYAPPLAVLVAAVGYALSRSVLARRWGSWVGAGAVAVLLVSQLPTTAKVVTENDVPDFGWAGRVVKQEVPADGVVLFDSPAPGSLWRQPFSGADRYLAGTKAEVVTVDRIAHAKEGVHNDGPVYLLILDSECAPSVVCDMPRQDWGDEVPGYRAVDRFDRFTLYEPVEGQEGTEGALTALQALTEAYGYPLAQSDVWAEARLLKREGRTDEAEQRIEALCQESTHGYDDCIERSTDAGLYAFDDADAG